jgi:hypothetical protein
MTNDQFSQIDNLLHLLPFAYHVTNAIRPTDCSVHVSGATHSLNITSKSRKAPTPSAYASSHLVPYHVSGTVQTEEWQKPHTFWLVCGSNITQPRPSTDHLPLSPVLYLFLRHFLHHGTMAPLFISARDLFVIVTLKHFWQHRNFADILYCSR